MISGSSGSGDMAHHGACKAANTSATGRCTRKEVGQIDLVADGLVALVPITAPPPPLRQAHTPLVMDPVVQAAETTYYRACVAEYTKVAEATQLRWGRVDPAECRRYRAAKSLKLPAMIRAVPDSTSEDGKGMVYGLTMGRNKSPYVAQAPTKAVELIKAVRTLIDQIAPSFRVTPTQLVVDARALHVDQGNGGDFRAISLRPHVGGLLGVHSHVEDDFQVAAPGSWFAFDGRRPHQVLPSAGERVAIVAHCSSGAFSACARPYVDLLTRQGFRPPEQMDTPITFPVSISANDKLLRNAWKWCARTVMESCAKRLRSEQERLEHTVKLQPGRRKAQGLQRV